MPSPESDTADPWLRRAAAAQHLGISVSLLEKLDSRGDGPPCARIGRARTYRLSDLNSFAVARIADGASSQPETPFLKAHEHSRQKQRSEHGATQ